MNVRDHILGVPSGGWRYEITSLDGIRSWFARPDRLRKKDEGARDWFNKNIEVKKVVSDYKGECFGYKYF